MAKVSYEEEKEAKVGRRIVTEKQKEALDEGRIFGGLSRAHPEVIQALEQYASVTGKKKTEIISEALELYFEQRTLHDTWRIVHGMTPEQLLASWNLFRYFLVLARRIYLEAFQDIFGENVQRYVEMVSKAREEGYRVGYEESKHKFEKRLESKKYEKIDKLMKKIDPLIDMVIDTLTDTMIYRMTGKKPTKFKVPVKVKGI